LLKFQEVISLVESVSEKIFLKCQVYFPAVRRRLRPQAGKVDLSLKSAVGFKLSATEPSVRCHWFSGGTCCERMLLGQYSF